MTLPSPAPAVGMPVTLRLPGSEMNIDGFVDFAGQVQFAHTTHAHIDVVYFPRQYGTQETSSVAYWDTPGTDPETEPTWRYPGEEIPAP